jgi:hypothetical protein
MLLIIWYRGVHYDRHISCQTMVQNIDSFINLTFMILLYVQVEAERNSAAIARLYAERYLKCRHTN